MRRPRRKNPATFGEVRVLRRKEEGGGEEEGIGEWLGAGRVVVLGLLGVYCWLVEFVIPLLMLMCKRTYVTMHVITYVCV